MSLSFHRKLNKTHWFSIGVFLVLVLTLLFNDSLHRTIGRRKALRDLRREIKETQIRIQEARRSLDLYHHHPEMMEQTVRRELGYIRPGEKEVRFLEKDK